MIVEDRCPSECRMCVLPRVEREVNFNVRDQVDRGNDGIVWFVIEAGVLKKAELRGVCWLGGGALSKPVQSGHEYDVVLGE